MGHHGAPRLTAFDYCGPRIYSVTCCTFERATWFTDVATVEPASTHLCELAAKWTFDVTYCFMPDHVHLVLEGKSDGSDLRKLMSAWKQQTADHHRRLGTGRLWQPGFYDHVLRDESLLLNLIAYVVQNPIRARLVACADEYPFWGSSVWTRPQLLEAIQGQTPSRGW